MFEVLGQANRSVPALQKSKNSALEKLKKISKWYTTADDDPGGAPHHKYTLRGVSTSNSTLYVLDRRSSGYVEPETWQWWKLTYSMGDAKPVSRTVSNKKAQWDADAVRLTISFSFSRKRGKSKY